MIVFKYVILELYLYIFTKYINLYCIFCHGAISFLRHKPLKKNPLNWI